MSMVLVVGGKPYDNFISGEIGIRLDVLCNSMEFTLSRSDADPLPFTVGERCEVFINDNLVFTGAIEVLSVSYSKNSHIIEIAGRDLTSDLLDSSVFEMSDIAEEAELKTIIEAVIKNIGSSLKVIQNFKPEKFNAINDIETPEDGDNAFNFLETHARQRQVLLSSTGEGNVLITRGSAVRSKAKFQNVIGNGSAQNNILSGSVSYDNTGRYNLYKLTGQGNPSAQANDGIVDLAPIVARAGGVFDTRINAGRQLVISSESAYSDEDMANRAIWEANIRQARGRLYTVSVQGFAFDGEVYGINKLASVADDFARIKDDMLINSLRFTFNSSEGEKTEITMLDKNSYQLLLEEPVGEL
jgi:prophage tail gpP-like protein